MQIDTIAYSSRLLKIDPKAKIVVGIAPLLLCIGQGTPIVGVATILIMGSATLVCSNISPAKYLRLLCIPAVFLLVGTITIIFCRVDSYDALFAPVHLFGHAYGVTTASLKTGVGLISRSLGAVSCMYFISLNCTITDTIKALQSFKTPAILISLMELMYRYIFVILEEALKMKTAQASRLGYKNFTTSIHSTGEVFGTLFIRSLMRCDRIYDALSSRGFDGELKILSQKYEKSTGLWLFGILTSFVLFLIGCVERGAL